MFKSMYEPNVDDYNWIGLSHDQSEIVKKSLKQLSTLLEIIRISSNKLEKTIEQHQNIYDIPTELVKNCQHNSDEIIKTSMESLVNLMDIDRQLLSPQKI